MDSREIISIYESVATIMHRMREAAQRGDWEQLVVLESMCSGQIATLRKEESGTALPEAIRDRKVQIIKKILEDDREIRSITQPWMTQLSSLISAAGTTQKLSRTYGPQSG